jgi:hypothetical protein
VGEEAQQWRQASRANKPSGSVFGRQFLFAAIRDSISTDPLRNRELFISNNNQQQ